MAIKVNLSSGVQQLAATATDKVLHNFAVRTSITGFSLFNTTSGNVAITLYESPDNTSASGKKVATHTLGPTGGEDDSVDVVEIIGQGYAADIRIVAVVNTAGISLGGVTGKLTYTQYTGDS